MLKTAQWRNLLDIREGGKHNWIEMRNLNEESALDCEHKDKHKSVQFPQVLK